MVISNISAGLGNQLFQYAVGLHLAMINKTEYKIDTSRYGNAEPDPMLSIRACGLDNFNITAQKASIEDLNKFLFLPKNKFFRHFIRFYSRPQNYFKKKYILEPEVNYFKFDPRVLSVKYKKDIYLDGYWLSEKYFKSIENIIRKEFSFKELPDKINDQIIQKMEKENSVCIHIRHGDNVNIPGGVTPLEYYYQAVTIIAQRIVNPVFYIFSDDPEWAHKNLKLDYPATYISHNGDKKNHEDLRLMTHCKHHIIGNSTFSWWGAWLAKNDQQIVISPKYHHSCILPLSETDYLPRGWLIL